MGIGLWDELHGGICVLRRKDVTSVKCVVHVSYGGGVSVEDVRRCGLGFEVSVYGCNLDDEVVGEVVAQLL